MILDEDKPYSQSFQVTVPIFSNSCFRTCRTGDISKRNAHNIDCNRTCQRTYIQFVGRKSQNEFRSLADCEHIFVNILMGTQMLFRGLEDDRIPSVGSHTLTFRNLASHI